MPSIQKSKATSRKRIQVDFTLKEYDQLFRIQQLSDAKTHTEVFRKALRIYTWFLDQGLDKDAKLQIIKSDTVREITIIL